jgi:glucokinase
LIARLRDGGTQGIGLCAPGLIDPDKGVVEYAANLGFRHTPLRDLISAAVGLPVKLDNDVRAACIAEYRVGDRQGTDDLMVVVLGTGLAAGLIVGGRLVAGATGKAGEFGHIPVVPNGELCSCGQRGCLEVYVSASGLLRRYQAAGGLSVSTVDLAARITEEPLARRIWTEGTEALGRGLVTAVMLLDPAVIVLAGGLAEAGGLLLNPVSDALAQGLAWRQPPPLEVSRLGTRAGVSGAALSALDSLGLTVGTANWTVG